MLEQEQRRAAEAEQLAKDQAEVRAHTQTHAYTDATQEAAFKASLEGLSEKEQIRSRTPPQPDPSVTRKTPATPSMA